MTPAQDDRSDDAKRSSPAFAGKVHTLMRGALLVGVVTLACLAMAFGGWLFTTRLTENIAKGQFDVKATECRFAVVDRLAAYEVALRGGLAFIKASGDVDRQHWREFYATMNLLQDYPGIQGFGYVRIVTDDVKQAYIQSVQREGFPGYDIRPAGTRLLYAPIGFLEPFDERNQRAFGYDMYSEPTRRAAMDNARDTGLPTISGKVTLVQETSIDTQAGFLMFAPVYRAEGHLDTLADRRQALRGFVYGVFRVNDFWKGVLAGGFANLGIDIYDGSEPTAPALMFQNAPEHSPASSERHPLFVSLVRKELFGRVWTMRFYSLPEFEATIDSTLPLVTLAGGLCVSILLAVILLSFSDTQRKATAIADSMTADLRASEERIKLILSSTGEPIYGIGVNGECTFCNPACIQALGYSTLEELLGKNMHALIHHTMADGSPYPVKDCPIFTAFLHGNEAHVVDELLWRADGSSFPVEYWSYPQIFNGKVVGAVVTFQDITERKRMEKDAANLASLVQAANRVAIIATDTSGRVTVFNKGAENLLGYEAAEITGASIEKIHAEEEMEKQGQLMTQQMQRPISGFEVLVARVREGDFEARQWTYLRKDGSRVPVELVVTAVCDKSQKLIGFLGVATDMTDRVKAERALRRSKERFQKLAQLSPVGIFETDAEGNCLFVNKRWQEFAGLSLKQALGRGWVDAIHPEDSAAVFSEWMEATERKREFALEYRFMSPEGNVTWVMGNAKAFRDESGELRGFFGTVMDIGKRIKAETALRESKARLSAVLDSAVDPIFTADAQGRILTANPAASVTFGYALAELAGQKLNVIMPEPFRSEHDQYLKRYTSTGNPHVIGKGGREVRGQRKDGTIIPFDISVSEFLNHGERQFTGILRDISERVRAREFLEAANAELAARQKIVDADMEAAAEIQRSLLPRQGTCSLGVEADFRFMPSTIIGGDIFNLVCLGPEHTGLYMVDVSGHGVPAALVSVSVAQELSPSGDVLMDRLSNEPRRPDDVLRLLDSAFPLERFDKFFSMFYLVYEPRSGKLTYCNAGHPSPMLLRAGGGLELLEEGGTLVGMGLGDTYAQGAVEVGDGDTLLVYTDGVTELENPQGGQFGSEQLAVLFQKMHKTSPEKILQAITGKLQAHADGRAPDDDISLFCVRFNKT